ncbi:hypothetical protein FOZ60_012757 [Perkinsus olseni]|uniref:TFIIS N-terminal domain-containing protein n=1 Tax=Perkinsus olseni TaxID=32597 RepID=A0A7J6NAQ0_PEROL|nr:hypothetical protein FOZ60_012757 [Perkinsus olseni]
MSDDASTTWSGLIENELPRAAAAQQEESRKIRHLMEAATGRDPLTTRPETSVSLRVGDASFEENLFNKACRRKRRPTSASAGSRLKRPRRNLSSAGSSSPGTPVSDGSARSGGIKKSERSEAPAEKRNSHASHGESLLDRLCDDEHMAGDSVIPPEAARKLTEAWEKEGGTWPSRETVDRLSCTEGLDEECVMGFWRRQQTRRSEGKRGSAKVAVKVEKSKERTKLLRGRVTNKEMVNRKFMKALVREKSPSVKRRALLSLFNDPAEAAKAEVLASFVNRKGIELLRDWLRELAGERDPDTPLVDACLSSLDQLEITEDTLRSTGIGRVVTVVVKRFTIASETVASAGRALLEKWKAIVTESRKAALAGSAAGVPSVTNAQTPSPRRVSPDPPSAESSGGPRLADAQSPKQMAEPVRDDPPKGGDDADLDCLMDLMGEEAGGGEGGQSTPKPRDQGVLSLMALPGSEDFEDEEEEKPDATLDLSASVESTPKIRWKEDSELVSMVLFEKNEPLWETVAAIANARGKHVRYVEHGHTSKFMEQRKKEAAMGGSHLGSDEKKPQEACGDAVTASVIFNHSFLPCVAVPSDCIVDEKQLQMRSYERQDLADLHGIRSEELYQHARVPNSPAEPDTNATILATLNGTRGDTVDMPLRTQPQEKLSERSPNSPSGTPPGSPYAGGYNHSAMVYTPYYGSPGYSQNELETAQLRMAYLQADGRYMS